MNDNPPGNKRLRLSLPSQRQLGLQLQNRTSPSNETDIINFFAERGGRHLSLQRESLESSSEIKRLRGVNAVAQQELASLKVKAPQVCHALSMPARPSSKAGKFKVTV